MIYHDFDNLIRFINISTAYFMNFENGRLIPFLIENLNEEFNDFANPTEIFKLFKKYVLNDDRLTLSNHQKIELIKRMEVYY